MTAILLATRQTIGPPPHRPEETDRCLRQDRAWPGLSAAAEDVGLPLSADQCDAFSRYRDLLLLRTERTNLTAIRDPSEVERRLFFPALLMLPALDEAIGAKGDYQSAPRLVDVGSGAGFPGLAIKIVRPHLDVTLIEATGKKVAFLAEVVAALGLDRVVAVHARAEDIGHRPDHRATYDVATARAVATLPALLELSAPLLRTGGTGLFPKGTDIGEELRAARRAAPLVGAKLVHPLALPDGSLLVRAMKTGATPARFPRRSGLPAREPLGATETERADPSLGPRKLGTVKRTTDRPSGSTR